MFLAYVLIVDEVGYELFVVLIQRPPFKLLLLFQPLYYRLVVVSASLGEFGVAPRPELQLLGVQCVLKLLLQLTLVLLRKLIKTSSETRQLIKILVISFRGVS